jgi:ATP-dependent protease ClpP protease subunit
MKLPWFDIRNAAGDQPEPGEEPGTASVYVYDEIGGSYGVDASAFADALDEITAPNISLRINSPGGSVFDGIAIHSSLLHHPATVTTYVDGLAASAASVIAMAGDRIVMMPGAQMMIHDASMTDDGGPADKESARVYLERQSDNIAGMYAARAGGDAAQWRDLMRAETWAFAQEAVDLGLADAVFERPVPAPSDPELAQRMRRSFDLSDRYRYAGRRAAPDPLENRDRVRQHVQRTAFTVPGEVHVSRETVDTIGTDMLEQLNGGPSKVVVHDGDRQNEATGRSIALIEAMLSLDD